jgi:hypothetical protein
MTGVVINIYAVQWRMPGGLHFSNLNIVKFNAENQIDCDAIL